MKGLFAAISLFFLILCGSCSRGEKESKSLYLSTLFPGLETSSDTKGKAEADLRWEFTEDLEGWEAQGDIEIRVDGGFLFGKDCGDKRFIRSPPDLGLVRDQSRGVIVKAKFSGGEDNPDEDRIVLLFSPNNDFDIPASLKKIMVKGRAIKKGGEFHEYTFPFPVRPPVVERFLLKPATSPERTFEIDMIEVISEFSYYRGREKGIEPVRIGDETRLSLFQADAATVTERFNVPRQGILRFGITGRGSADILDYSVKVLPLSGDKIEIFHERMEPSGPWKDFSVDLSGYRGKEISLEFSNRAESGDGIGFWGAVGVHSLANREAGNVIVYLIDTLRADHLGCYGYERETSSTMDRLAAEGVLFKKCYAQAPWTKPSTASILTSQHSAVHGANDVTSVVPDSAVTLAEELKAAGFTTLFLTSNEWVSPQFGFTQGFDYVRERYRSEEEELDAGALPSSYHLNKLVFDWLDKHEGERFFIYIHSMDPHWPYSCPNRFYSDLPKGFEDHFRDQYHDVFIYSKLEEMKEMTWDEILADHDLPVKDTGQMLIDLYDGEIKFNDTQIKYLLKKLDNMGIGDSTLFALVSDHGEEFFEHGCWEHGHSLYEEMIHVPFIVRWPGMVPRGVTIDHPVATVDMVPTILDLLELPPLPDQEGRSLMEAMKGGILEESAVFSQRYGGAGINKKRADAVRGGENHALIKGDLFLIENRAMGTYELFNRNIDPGQKWNLANSEEENLKKLSSELDAWVEKEEELGEQLHGAVGKRKREVDTETLERLRHLGYIE